MSQRRLLEAPLQSESFCDQPRLSDVDVEVDVPAIWVRHGRPPHMPRPHRHDDLELNFVVSGELDYLFGGMPLKVCAGQIAVFWGATPHRLVEQDDESSIECLWVHIPLETVFGWALPRDYLSDLLTSRPIVLPSDSAGRDVESMFHSWMSDLMDEGAQDFALLEIHALVRRLLHRHAEHLAAVAASEGAAGADPAPLGLTPTPGAHADGMQHVVEMARYVTANFRSEIAAADIARATHLNPNYAMTLFRETVGTTLGAYLTRCRVAEAQRLLLTTSLTTVEIADAAGFGSQSSFYAHFTRTCGVSPSAYRRSLR
ncbi:helix-turn-helix domain-containing protein [Frondihabitans australicus]|uniref:AraC family transcriptional regulator n=1 Tax=Frondihabitans australicus TaxID=386892 RepID=A0A495IEE8_9MICO|nr:helix-turn-helix domain-containing protein [Frondihabitans australicus]RKR73505.1 AraC family transcriptional regulator [Frondihabitans australicus]